MANPETPWRTNLSVDSYLDSDDEIRSKVAACVAGILTGDLTDVELVFCGLDGDSIGPTNYPPVKEGLIFVSELEHISGRTTDVDPMWHAGKYDTPAIVVYDHNKLEPDTDSDAYHHSDDAVLGVIFLEEN